MKILRRSGMFALLLGITLLGGPPAAADGNQADLSASTEQGFTYVLVGDVVHTGPILVQNRGPHEATGILFTVKLTGPGEFDATLLPSLCRLDGSAVTCKLDNLPAGFHATIPDIVVDTTALGTIVESWTATASEDDPTPSDNSGTVTTGVASALANLAGGIAGPSDLAGQTLSATGYVTNFGPQDATGVIVTDTLSGPATFDAAASDPGCSASGQTVTCSIGTLDMYESRTVTIAFAVTPGTVWQTEHVSAAAPPDPYPYNDDSTISTNVTSPAADLEAAISGPTTFTGQTLPAFVDAINNGPQAANGVVVTDIFSGPGSFDAAASDPRCSASGQTITCSADSVAASAIVSFEIEFALSGSGTFSQTAHVSGGSPPDPNPANDSRSFTTTVISPTADLAASITGPGTITGARTLSATASAANVGPDPVSGIVLTDTFSGPGTFDAAASAPGCSASGQTVTCNLNSLAVGATAQFTIAFAVTGPGTFSQTLQVAAADVVDPNPTNDTANLTTVIPSADLQGAFSSVTLTPGTVTVQFVVTNLGPDDEPAPGARFTWSPSGTGGAALAGYVASGGFCTGGKAFVTPPLNCSTSALPNGASQTIDVTLTAASGTTVTITASATGSLFDPNQGNNTASVSVVVP